MASGSETLGGCRFRLELKTTVVEWEQKFTGTLCIEAEATRSFDGVRAVILLAGGRPSPGGPSSLAESVLADALTVPAGGTRKFRVELGAVRELALQPLEVGVEITTRGTPLLLCRRRVRIVPPPKFAEVAEALAAAFSAPTWAWMDTDGTDLTAVIHPAGVFRGPVEAVYLSWSQEGRFSTAQVEVDLRERSPADFLRAMSGDDRLRFNVRPRSADLADWRRELAVIAAEVAVHSGVNANLPLPSSPPDAQADALPRPSERQHPQ